VFVDTAPRRTADERVPGLVADRATEDLGHQTGHSQRRDQQTARTTMEGQPANERNHRVNVELSICK